MSASEIARREQGDVGDAGLTRLFRSCRGTPPKHPATYGLRMAWLASSDQGRMTWSEGGCITEEELQNGG